MPESQATLNNAIPYIRETQEKSPDRRLEHKSSAKTHLQWLSYELGGDEG